MKQCKMTVYIHPMETPEEQAKRERKKAENIRATVLAVLVIAVLSVLVVGGVLLYLRGVL